MRCPCCQEDLKVTHRDRYQSLDEHVSDPNGTPSMKDGYQCLNDFCVANNLRAVWTSDGDLFIDPPTGIKSTVAHKILEATSVTGTYHALDTWSSYYEIMTKNKEKRKKHLELGKYKVVIFPNYLHTDKGPWKRQLLPSYEIWKRSEDSPGSWTHMVPLHKMVKFSLGKFKRSKNLALEGNKGDLDECYNIIHCITPWGKPEDRLYAKITSFLVKIIYPFTSRKITSLHNA